LTYIPPKVILDLSKYVVLPGETLDDCRIVQPLVKPHAKRVFARFQTAPAATTSLFGSAQARQKSASSSQVLSGTSMHQIDMYLSNNGISKLPTELSALKNLRILSLSMLRRFVSLSLILTYLQGTTALDIFLQKSQNWRILSILTSPLTA